MVPQPKDSPLSKRRKWRVWSNLEALGISIPLIVCILILTLTPLFIENEYILRLLVVSLLFGALAMAFDFTGGFINAVNFGFAGFVGLGAYTSGLLIARMGWSPWLGLIAGMLMTGLVGFFTGILTLPLRGIYVSLMSWFVGMTLMALANAMVDLTRGARGLIVPPLYEAITITDHLYLLLALTILLYIILRMIIRSRVGLAFRAIGQNYDVARASGVHPVKYKLLNFTLSSAVAGLLGAYYASFIGIITPDLLDMSHTLEVMALAFIGGSGSLIGGVFAAFLLIPLFDSLRKLMEYRLIIYGLSLVLIMIFYPAGLAGFYQYLSEKIRTWKGKLNS